MSEELYVWADKTDFGIGEHTWVSDYKPAEGEPDPSHGAYWYCWGGSHAEAELVASGNGGADFANKVAKPHSKKETAGILYGKDGVCHQMANRLSRFSLGVDGRPITAKGAKGYLLTKAMYGEYGDKARSASQRARLQWWLDIVDEHEQSDNN